MPECKAMGYANGGSNLDAATIDLLARELIDPATTEFSIPIGNDAFLRVQERADAIELESRDAA